MLMESERKCGETMKTILIIDDDVHIGNVLEEILTREGYHTLRAYSGTEAILVLAHTVPDLILLDLMLPGVNGEEVLAHIQGIPVIVVSARIAVDDKVNVLLSGAADYITKPFDTKELLARVAVQLRKQKLYEPSAYLVYHDISLNSITRKTMVQDTEVKLIKTEFAILRLLLLNPDQVMTKSLLLERISADTPDCTESSLKMHISNLRKKLRVVTGTDYIEAVWGIGFKLKT